MQDKDPTGRFYAGDGRPPQPVSLIETPDHLEMRDSMSLLVAAWAWQDIVTHTRSRGDRPFRYTCRPFPGQRVETHDPGFLTERLTWERDKAPSPVSPARPPRRKAARPSGKPPQRARTGKTRDQRGGWGWPSPRALTRFLMVALGTLCVGAVLGITAMVLPGLANRLAVLVPASTERDWGEALVGDLRDHGLLFCDNIYGTQALDRLTRRLTGSLNAPWPIRVHVVKSDRAQILTLPGGQMILFEGLVNAARTPDEIAGLLAHALAHGILRHGTESLIARYGLPALAALLREDFSAPEISLEAYLAQKDSNLSEELAADALAVKALLAADLRAHGLPLALEWLETRPADMETLGRSRLVLAPQGALHPPYPDRLKALRRAPRGGGEAMDPLDWEAFKLVCR
ncbi:M48 family metallopeptidase [Rhodospirillum sp. A1_3_36]|uniref:M48 family metallopeptidase n=1 Tax=Rhodospirillum sp. A1_3_36 TaxID=3391666 RepID=UPI0039A596BC